MSNYRLFHLNCSRKGQINIDYIFAFFILALSTIYAANIAFDSVGPFYNTLSRNNLHAEAWIFSEMFVRNITVEKNEINESLLESYSNKTLLLNTLDTRYQYRQKIIVDQYPLILTMNVTDDNHTGSAVFNKTYNPITVNFTVWSTTGYNYDRVDIENETGNLVLDLKRDMSINISSVEYSISAIDKKGNFVALERTALSYGWGSQNMDMVSVNRYLILDGFMARVNILFY